MIIYNSFDTLLTPNKRFAVATDALNFIHQGYRIRVRVVIGVYVELMVMVGVKG